MAVLSDCKQFLTATFSGFGTEGSKFAQRRQIVSFAPSSMPKVEF
jgi:hypothetical protein